MPTRPPVCHPVRPMMRLAILFFISVLTAAPALAGPPKIAVFDLELIDTSLEAGRGDNADQAHRLESASAELRRLLAESGQVEIVELAPEAAEIRKQAPLHKCNGCDEDIARRLGADLEVVSIIQKTSNLILSFASTIKDVRTQKVIRVGQVDIRGNTDETWLRGIRWLVKNRLLETPLAESR